MYHTSHNFNIHSLRLGDDFQSYYVATEGGGMLCRLLKAILGVSLDG